jgi:hypothetical protein
MSARNARVVAVAFLVGGCWAPCFAQQAHASEAAETVTFNKHVAPLVFARCADCHRPGEVAPFSLLTFHDVSKRADQILSVAEQRAMPPWKPQPGHGEFAHNRRLTDKELGLLRRWVAQGAVEGQAADLPPAPSFGTGWQLGTPDLVVTMPIAAEVAAAGPDVYLNTILTLKVPEGKFVKAAEFRPSNRRVVHHAVLFVDTTGKARERDEADPALGFVAVTPPGKRLPDSLSIWAPGRNPRPLGPGLSMPWPETGELVLQLHLHPTGKPEVEQSSIGFHFTDEPPARSLLDLTLIDTKIDIPPGEKAYRTSDRCVLPIDMDALSIFPHMHMIGKDIKVTATLPDGTSRPLLWIDDWNFNWQDLYEYAKPVRLPKGTQIVLEAVHDNSADNPFNPSSPPQRVRWGEQTFNEMSIAFLNLVPVRESDMSELQANPARRLQAAIVPAATKATLASKPKGNPASVKKPLTAEEAARRAEEALRKGDKDGNGKLNLEEVVALLDNRLSSAELAKLLAPFDRDGDKQLNLSEATAVIQSLTKR